MRTTPTTPTAQGHTRRELLKGMCAAAAAGTLPAGCTDSQIDTPGRRDESRPLIGNMLGRIGELLDIEEQIGWAHDAGFDGVGFHASPGTPGVWQGIDPAGCRGVDRRRVRKDLARFRFVEIHAPFAIWFKTDTLAANVEEFRPILEFAGDLGVSVVTLHTELPYADATDQLAPWRQAMQKVDADADRAGVKVGVEIPLPDCKLDGFKIVRGWDLANVGVTLDVGHVYAPIESGHGIFLKHFGGIENVIRQARDLLVHLHVHDVVDGVDHNEAGAGIVEFPKVAAALREIGYRRGMCLELNGDRVGPEGILRSKEHLQACFRHLPPA